MGKLYFIKVCFQKSTSGRNRVEKIIYISRPPFFFCFEKKKKQKIMQILNHEGFLRAVMSAELQDFLWVQCWISYNSSKMFSSAQWMKSFKLTSSAVLKSSLTALRCFNMGNIEMIDVYWCLPWAFLICMEICYNYMKKMINVTKFDIIYKNTFREHTNTVHNARLFIKCKFLQQVCWAMHIYIGYHKYYSLFL